MPRATGLENQLAQMIFGADPSVPQEAFRRQPRPRFHPLDISDIPENRLEEFLAFRKGRRQRGLQDEDFDLVRFFLSSENPAETGHLGSIDPVSGRPLKDPLTHGTFFKEMLLQRFPGLQFQIDDPNRLRNFR